MVDFFPPEIGDQRSARLGQLVPCFGAECEDPEETVLVSNRRLVSIAG